eukprot:742249-Prymnesium_polylepis.1
MLPPGHTSYILLQSVGYEHTIVNGKVDYVSDDDGEFAAGLKLWREHSDELTDGTRFLALQLGDLTSWHDACSFRAIQVTRDAALAGAAPAEGGDVPMGEAASEAAGAMVAEADDAAHDAVLARAIEAYKQAAASVKEASDDQQVAARVVDNASKELDALGKKQPK